MTEPEFKTKVTHSKKLIKILLEALGDVAGDLEILTDEQYNLIQEYLEDEI